MIFLGDKRPKKVASTEKLSQKQDQEPPEITFKDTETWTGLWGTNTQKTAADVQPPSRSSSQSSPPLAPLIRFGRKCCCGKWKKKSPASDERRRNTNIRLPGVGNRKCAVCGGKEAERAPVHLPTNTVTREKRERDVNGCCVGARARARALLDVLSFTLPSGTPLKIRVKRFGSRN